MKLLKESLDWKKRLNIALQAALGMAIVTTIYLGLVFPKYAPRVVKIFIASPSVLSSTLSFWCSLVVILEMSVEGKPLS